MKARRKYIPKSAKAGREDSRRFATNVSLGLLVVGGLIVLIAVANRWMAKEELREIRIEGRIVLDTAEILEIAAIPDSVPVSKIDLVSIESNIEAHPFVSDASVYRGERGALVLDITERTPVAVVFIEGEPIYLDNQGVALPHRFSSAAFDIPVLSGIGENAGEKSVDSAYASQMLGTIRTLKEHNELLYREISEIHRDENGEYIFLHAERGIPIKAGYPEEIPGRLAKLDAFLTTVLAVRPVKDIRYIDLRWDGQVVVRWKNERMTRNGIRESRATTG